jgi:hypothetical protein
LYFWYNSRQCNSRVIITQSRTVDFSSKDSLDRLSPPWDSLTVLPLDLYSWIILYDVFMLTSKNNEISLGFFFLVVVLNYMLSQVIWNRVCHYGFFVKFFKFVFLIACQNKKIKFVFLIAGFVLLIQKPYSNFIFIQIIWSVKNYFENLPYWSCNIFKKRTFSWVFVCLVLIAHIIHAHPFVF